MRHSMLGLVLVFCSALFAAQPGTTTTTTVSPNSSSGGNSDPNSSNIFQTINDQLKVTRNAQHAEGFGPVTARQAKVCEICKQPLFKHADPNFECIPVDEDGEQRKMIRIQTRAAQCPVCSKALIGSLAGNYNSKGGSDRDFCEHSLGRYAVHSRVWVCPNCGYAALYENFNTTLDGKPIDEATKQYVRENLSKNMLTRMYDIVGLIPKANQAIPEELQDFGSYIPQNEIPDWVKYENALKIYERVKPPRGFLASLYLEAAHANRREVCSEISVSGLHNATQVTLGRSIRLINGYLQGQCLAIRRRQGASILDPTKMETDPEILAQACGEIIHLGEENYATAATPTPADQTAQPERFFSSGDMFVLNVRYAGILDRLGKLDDAERTLRRAASYIPDKASGLSEAENTPAAQEYYTHQVKLIRLVVDDRLACLQRAKDYLFNAAKFNMLAIKLGEVKFAVDGQAEQSKVATLDAAPTSYLLGELLRRAGEPGAAAVWFDTAGSVVAQRLSILEKLTPQRTPQQSDEEYKEAQNALTAKRERWMMLRDWIKEQRALIKNPPPVDANVMDSVNVVLQAEGVNLKAGPALVQTPVRPTTDVDPKKGPAPAAPTGSGKIKTRDELYKFYYKALLAYRAAKGEDPPTLADLVRAGFITREDSCQDDKGRLFCPETGDKLGYARNWDKGDKTAAVIWSSTNMKSKRLFADGSIRDADAK